MLKVRLISWDETARLAHASNDQGDELHKGVGKRLGDQQVTAPVPEPHRVVRIQRDPPSLRVQVTILEGCLGRTLSLWQDGSPVCALWGLRGKAVLLGAILGRLPT